MQGFVKSMLEVADNLERAVGAVPPYALDPAPEKPVSPEEALRLLHSLVEGVQMTDKILQQVCMRLKLCVNSRFHLAFHCGL